MTVVDYEYRLNGGSPVSAGTSLIDIATGLTPVTDYALQMRAVDDIGQRSAWSSIVATVTDIAGIQIIAHTSGPSSDGLHSSCGPIDSSNATCIVLIGGDDDDQGNTFTDTPNFFKLCNFPNTSASHNFTGSTFSNGAIAVIALANTNVVESPFDIDVGSTVGSDNHLATGLITPSEDKSIIIAISVQQSASVVAPTVDSGFTILDFQPYNGANFPMAIAYKIQTTATAVNPTFTWDHTAFILARAAVFKHGPPPPDPSTLGLRINTGSTTTQGRWQNHTIYLEANGSSATDYSTPGVELNDLLKPGRAKNTNTYSTAQEATVVSVKYKDLHLTPSINCLVRVHTHDKGLGAGFLKQKIKANGVDVVSAYDIGTYSGGHFIIGIKEFIAAADVDGNLEIELVPQDGLTAICHGLEIRQPVPSVIYRKITISGDSITRGGGPVSAQQNWPSVLATLMTGGSSAVNNNLTVYDVPYDEVYPWAIHDISLSGDTYPGQTTQLTTYAVPHDYDVWEKQIVFSMAGHNDPGVLGSTEDQIIDHAKAFFAACPVGWIKGVGTILDQADVFGNIGHFNTYNAWVRDHALQDGFVDFIVDWDVLWTNNSWVATDLAVLYDGIHPTIATHAAMAAYIQPILEAL